MNYGCIITSLIVPDKDGKAADIVLGFDSLQPYLDGHPYFGAMIGRYANRIAGGKFSLDGKEYILEQNNGENHLHGGVKGFDKQVWDYETFQGTDVAGVEFNYKSQDGEEGYPGELHTKIIYSLNNKNELSIATEATTDKATPVNIVHHSYFNLAGAGNGDILDHVLMIDADYYTDVDDGLIPTGALINVSGGPFDFRTPKTIGRDIGKLNGGYDHNFVLNKPLTFRKFIEVYDPSSGRQMSIRTNEPGVQFYTGNFLNDSISGKDGKALQKHAGFCLETQKYPDSPNQPSFPNTILRPGEKYQNKTVYSLEIR